MKKYNFLQWMGVLSAVFALVCGFDPGFAYAQKTVPTCNSLDATGVPIFSTATPPNTTGTKLCTDYFGVGNWANSPLPTAPIDITATGITIVDGGSGYTAPVVTVTDNFNSPSVVPAACSATVDVNGSVTGIIGSITGITCSSGGSGYMAPVVSITDATSPGAGAWVLAKLSATGPFVGGIPKFVDALPNLQAALATPDKTTYPGSDYFEIALVEAQTTMHASLPPTKVRGYVQVPSGSNSCTAAAAAPYKYLGPVILAQKDRPVRVKFTNCLPTGTGGDLFIPSDSTYMGAGMGPDGTSPYLENRATLHLHGGNTPWISDGTPHQWTVPVGETATYSRGVSTQMVPDMYYLNGVVVPACSATVTTNCSGGTPAQLPPGATNDPGQGSMTFYWTNQQGGRLMFYHDHAYGITRLNVYAGEAAGFLLTDPVEESALAAVNVPGTVVLDQTLVTPANPFGIKSADLTHLIPLVIQDKTFIPSQTQLAAQDPTWVWGTTAVSGVNGNGDLWFPHVYIPNQNPFDPGGANAFGRWDYGAWFFPAQTTLTAAGTGPLGPNTAVTIPCTSSAFPGQLLAPAANNNYLAGCPIIPNPSGTPEGFMDTPVINGKAYPVLHVAPEAYRFKILSAGNDRSWNLQLYVADATGMEVPMLPAYPPSTGSILPLCRTVNQLTTPALGIGLPTAILDPTGNPLNGTGLPANCWPNYGAPSPGIYSKQFMWSADGRDGGVPDPRSAGPPFVQIGTEGGLLPAPVVIPSTPVNYEVNVKSITVTNVSAHALWLGPAERADAIVDFSRFAGKTLILYNDAPVPAPAYDLRDDFFTGDLDMTSTGGAPATVPGYGPNTRTVMQIIVDQPGTGQTPFNVATLINGIPNVTPGLAGIFKMTQPAIVVPESTYTAASGGNAPTDTYAKVQDNTITYQPTGLPVATIAVNNGGSGYSATPLATIDPPGCAAPVCSPAVLGTPTVVNGVITSIPLTNIGSGYTTVPAINISDATGSGASATAVIVTTVRFDGKAIQELFTLDYGRMNATLGNELPLTNFLVQTTLPFGYAEWPTEILQENTPQIWYLTHNGVDTHFIHFHLFNVQVINRVGWDGSVRPPEQNELGWKDTVRMNQLENIIFAVKPITPVVPFPLPDSIRLMDPTMPEGVVSPAMSGIDPATGNAIPGNLGTINARVNFGHEYVWHCHILGHEENDMMRAMIYQVPPAGPTYLLAAAPPPATPGAFLTWTDNSASETAFIVQRDAIPTFDSPVLASFTVDGSSANTAGFSTLGYGQTVTFHDISALAGNTYFYRVQAEDNFLPQSPLTASAVPLTPPAAPFQTVPLFSAWSNTTTIGIIPLTPAVTFTGAPATAGFGATFTVTATTNSSIVPTITGTNGICTVGAVSGTAASAIATVNMTSGTGTCLLTATWAPDPFFGGATATQTTLATLVAPAVTFTGAPTSAVYNSTFTVTATTNAGVAPTSITGNTVCSVGTVSGTSPATALVTMTSGTGICTLTATWPATANYATATLTQSTTAMLATPTFTWPAPAAITYGTALSSTQLNATASFNATPVLGTFTYTPAAGTVLPVGNRTLSVTFAPALSANFTPASTTVTLVVNPAALTVTASSTAMIYGGPVPAITPIYSGFVNGDTAATAVTTPPICSTTATSASTVSPPTYPSSCTGGAAANYTFSFVVGAVTVNKATSTTTITAHTPSPSIVGQVVTVSFMVAPQFSGTPAGAVTVSASTGQTCTGTLSAGTGSCTMSFIPGGSRTLTATYAGNANFLASVSAGVPHVVSSVSLSTNSLLFGNQLVGTNSARQTITLSNVGTTPLPISSITLGGPSPFNFTTTCGASLAVGRSCAINMRYSPTATGVNSATLSIINTDPASPQLVSLTGTGVAPIAAVSPNTRTFSSPLNVTTAAQTITLTNTGTAPLVINNIVLGGTNPAQFAQTNNCGASLAAGASCTINVTFRPTTVTPGTKSASLNLNVAAPATSQSVSLTGTVLTPVLALSPASWAFGTQTRNTTSAPKTVTVSNTGTAPLTISSISFGGANPLQFAQTNNCGSVAVGSSCTINVTFRPTTPGPKSASLNVNPAAPATSQSVALTGTGQ